MTLASSGALIDALRDQGLLSVEVLAELPHLVQGRLGEARALARILVQRGWLSVYQINQILEGKAHELIIGPYHVLDRLGKGGLSQVFKVRHVTEGWIGALKVLSPEATINSLGRQQFLHEIEAMARLDHPNIVQFCDVDEAGDAFYFCMEYVEGTDLGKLVRLTGPLSVREACEYIRQAALGLQHAHEHNVVHRDIKPLNLLLTHIKEAVTIVDRHGKERRVARPKPLVKILDWGLASLHNPSGQSVPEALESLAKGIIGTADYLSPEQARDALTVDTRGDIYSLGCTFYFLLTGQPPFPNGSLMQKVMQHQKAIPDPLTSFRQDVPDDVENVLNRMMAKEPEERFQIPAAIALALSPYARQDGAAVPTPVRMTPNTSRRRDDTPMPNLFSQPKKISEVCADTSFPRG